jgi:hypothetical protein
MPVFKLVWQFQESNGATFNEVYYREAANAAAAAAVPNNLDLARAALLHPLNRLLRIRSSQVDAQRVTGLNSENRIGTAPGAGGPLPAGAAAVLNLAGAAGGSRKLWLRGAPQAWYVRNGTSGADAPPAAFLTALTEFYTALGAAGYGIRRLATPVPGPTSPLAILKVDGALNAGQALVTLAAQPGYAVGSRVLIGGASKKDLPSLNGQFTVVVVNGAIVTIPYQTPKQAVVVGGNGTMRQANYQALSVILPAGCSFDHYGTRTSKNPLSNSRGARRAVKQRLSL